MSVTILRKVIIMMDSRVARGVCEVLPKPKIMVWMQDVIREANTSGQKVVVLCTHK